MFGLFRSSKIPTDCFNTDKLNNGEIKVKYPFDGGLFVKDSQGNKYKVVTSGKAGDYSLMVIVDNKKIPLEEFLNSH